MKYEIGKTYNGWDLRDIPVGSEVKNTTYNTARIATETGLRASNGSEVVWNDYKGTDLRYRVVSIAEEKESMITEKDFEVGDTIRAVLKRDTSSIVLGVLTAFHPEDASSHARFEIAGSILINSSVWDVTRTKRRAVKVGDVLNIDEVARLPKGSVVLFDADSGSERFVLDGHLITPWGYKYKFDYYREFENDFTVVYLGGSGENV